MQMFQIPIDIEPFIIGWLFSSVRPEKENDFEFGESSTKQSNISKICLLLLTLLYFCFGLPLYCPSHCHFLVSAICIVFTFLCLIKIIIYVTYKL